MSTTKSLLAWNSTVEGAAVWPEAPTLLTKCDQWVNIRMGEVISRGLPETHAIDPTANETINPFTRNQWQSWGDAYDQVAVNSVGDGVAFVATDDLLFSAEGEMLHLCSIIVDQGTMLHSLICTDG